MGEIDLRAFLNHDPNIARIEIYNELVSQNKKEIDLKSCSECFQKNQYMRKNEENGLYLNDSFQPLVSYYHNNIRYPLVFASRSISLSFLPIKLISNFLNLEISILIAHLLFFIITFILLMRFEDNHCFLFLLASSSIFMIQQVNYIPNKFFSLCLYFLLQKKESMKFLYLAYFNIFISKITGLLYIISVFLSDINLKQIKKHLFPAAFFIILFAILSLFVNSKKEFYYDAEYLKPVAYWILSFIDLIGLMGSSEHSLSYITGRGAWFLPHSAESVIIKDIAYWKVLKKVFLSNFQTVPLLLLLLYGFFKDKNKQIKVYKIIFFSWGLITLAAHKYNNYCVYFIGLYPLIIYLYFKAILQLKRSFRVLFFIFWLSFNFSIYLDFYNKGPMSIYSLSFNKNIANFLNKNNILNPIMLYIYDIGNIEIHDERIQPIYIAEEKFQNIDELLKLVNNDYMLIQLKPDYFDSKAIGTLTINDYRDKLLENELDFDEIKTFSWNGKNKYWLIKINTNKTFPTEYKSLPKKLEEKLYYENMMFR